VAPYDKTIPVRDDIVYNLEKIGFEIERFHHEVATGGIQEVNYKYSDLLHAGDDMQAFKYIVRNTAEAHGQTATFMPKPLAGDGGSVCTPTNPSGRTANHSSTMRLATPGFPMSPATTSAVFSNMHRRC